MNNIIIRKIAEEDNAALAKMIRSVFEEYNAPKCNTVYSDPTTNDLYKLFRKPKSVLWVTFSNGEIAGCCGVYPTEGLEEGSAELVKFYLAAAYRGKGIGRQLMQQSLQSAKEFGYTKIYLESMPQFATAVSMYEKYGFKNLDQAMGNSGHTSCTIWMIKSLE